MVSPPFLFCLGITTGAGALSLRPTHSRTRVAQKGRLIPNDKAPFPFLACNGVFPSKHVFGIWLLTLASSPVRLKSSFSFRHPRKHGSGQSRPGSDGR